MGDFTPLPHVVITVCLTSTEILKKILKRNRRILERGGEGVVLNGDKRRGGKLGWGGGGLRGEKGGR